MGYELIDSHMREVPKGTFVTEHLAADLFGDKLEDSEDAVKECPRVVQDLAPMCEKIRSKILCALV